MADVIERSNMEVYKHTAAIPSMPEEIQSEDSLFLQSWNQVHTKSPFTKEDLKAAVQDRVEMPQATRRNSKKCNNTEIDQLCSNNGLEITRKIPGRDYCNLTDVVDNIPGAVTQLTEANCVMESDRDLNQENNGLNGYKNKENVGNGRLVILEKVTSTRNIQIDSTKEACGKSMKDSQSAKRSINCQCIGDIIIGLSCQLTVSIFDANENPLPASNFEIIYDNDLCLGIKRVSLVKNNIILSMIPETISSCPLVLIDRSKKIQDTKELNISGNQPIGTFSKGEVRFFGQCESPVSLVTNGLGYLYVAFLHSIEKFCLAGEYYGSIVQDKKACFNNIEYHVKTGHIGASVSGFDVEEGHKVRFQEMRVYSKFGYLLWKTGRNPACFACPRIPFDFTPEGDVVVVDASLICILDAWTGKYKQIITVGIAGSVSSVLVDSLSQNICTLDGARSIINMYDAIGEFQRTFPVPTPSSSRKEEAKTCPEKSKNPVSNKDFLDVDKRNSEPNGESSECCKEGIQAGVKNEAKEDRFSNDSSTIKIIDDPQTLFKELEITVGDKDAKTSQNSQVYAITDYSIGACSFTQDFEGNFIVVNCLQNSVCVFQYDSGNCIFDLQSEWDFLVWPVDVTTSENGSLYVADHGNSCIKKYKYKESSVIRQKSIKSES